MKALSIYPEYATEIAMGWKTIEYRTWETKYRGDIAICSSKKPHPGTVAGHALCVVELVDIEVYGEKDFGWVLENPRMIKPVPVRGQLYLWDYNGPVEIIPDEEWCVTEDASDEEAEARWASFVEKYWEPIMTK